MSDDHAAAVPAERPPLPDDAGKAHWAEIETVVRRLSELLTPHCMADVEYYLQRGENGLAVMLIADELKLIHYT